MWFIVRNKQVLNFILLNAPMHTETGVIKFL